MRKLGLGGAGSWLVQQFVAGPALLQEDAMLSLPQFPHIYTHPIGLLLGIGPGHSQDLTPYTCDIVRECSYVRHTFNSGIGDARLTEATTPRRVHVVLPCFRL